MKNRASPLARSPVVSAALTLVVLLVVFAGRYGYHRDELYFRLLPPAWGYLDQPPLTPWVARVMTGMSDQLWVLRLPSAGLAAGSVVVIALLVAEVGGSRVAQGLAAWGYAFGTLTLTFGHVVLTASLDLLVWPTVTLFVVRAVWRGEPRWWWLAGVVAGLSTYNKWLIVLLGVSLVGGFLLAGPRDRLLGRGPVGGVLIALVLAAPNVGWQLTHGWPQLAMGQALAAKHATEVRISTIPPLVVMIGPLVFAFLIAGVVSLARNPDWRPIRFLAPALGLAIALTLIGGTQFYYPYGLVSVVFALGCVPTTRWATARPRRWVGVRLLLALHVASNIVISLPVLPLPVLARSTIPDLNAGVRDQLGWPTYVEQVDRVLDRALVADPDLVVLASNYGEAGALDRFSRHRGVPVLSGQNSLGERGGPDPSVTTVVVVGGQLRSVQADFARCEVADRLKSGLGIDNEEEAQPIALCHGPRQPWSRLWPTLRHLD